MEKIEKHLLLFSLDTHIQSHTDSDRKGDLLGLT